jgi:hypothetical protein
MKLAKKWLISIIIGGVVILLAGSFAVVSALGLFGGGYAVNKPDDETGRVVADGFYLYSGDGIGYAFQYPTTCAAGWDDSDGAYLYCGKEGSTPYILISRKNKRGMNPNKYFKVCDGMMLERFTNLQSTPIQEAAVGEKTLYLVRYLSGDLVIDRYLELYDSFYIEYTAVSNEKGSLNTELYYAITTLQVETNAYVGAYSDKLSFHRAEDLGLAIEIPDMLDTKELTIGYYASSDDAIMLTVWIEKDDDGKAIYNRQDFIDRASQSPVFVAGLLGADSASFTQGKEESYGGKSFYCYPMELSVGEEAFSGELCLANANESGCWLVCYAVRGGSPMQADLLTLMKECASNVVID